VVVSDDASAKGHRGALAPPGGRRTGAPLPAPAAQRRARPQLPGRALALLAGIGATALASRYLGQDGFGALTLGMAIVSLIALLTDLGLFTIAAREIAREAQRRREILGNAPSLGLAFSVVAALVLIAIVKIAHAGNPHIHRAILVLSVQLLPAPFLSASRAYFQAAQRGQPALTAYAGRETPRRATT
jgi:O-antigen/teichoic acid export membrane protein